MALLLAMYQKMRLIREKNQLSLDLIKVTGKKDRVTKNISRVQKLFESRKAKLDAQAKMYTSQMKSAFQQNLGLYLNNSSYLSNSQFYTGNYGTNNAYIQGRVTGYMDQWQGENAGKLGYPNTLDEAVKNNLIKVHQAGLIGLGGVNNYAGEGKIKLEGNQYTFTLADNSTISIDKESVDTFIGVLQKAQSDFGMANMCLNQANTDLESNVSIWLEAQTTKLEEEQDQALEPLSYQETMWDLEKTQLETRLKTIEAELDTYKQMVDKEAQDAAPKFGL